jgi:ABC-type glycerol-3-phosphate transport system permease component
MSEIVVAKGAAPASTVGARTFRPARIVLYAVLLVFAVYYLLPLYVMVVNSLKPLRSVSNRPGSSPISSIPS